MLSPCLAWCGPTARHYNEDYVDTEEMSKRDMGTLFHKQAELLVTRGWADPGINETVAVWVDRAYIYLQDDLMPRCDEMHPELALGINWTRLEAMVLDGVKDRNYPKNEGWQYGTADLVCLLKTGEMYVADWKTGGTDGAEEQLLSLAYAVQRSHQTPDGPRPIIISCLGVNEHGVWPKERSVSNEELDAHADAMRFQWEDIGKRNGPVPGIHCTTLYCPHLAYCDAITAVTQQAATVAQEHPINTEPLIMVNGGHRLTDTPASDDEAGYVMANASAAKRQIKYWELAMKKYIDSGGKVTAGQYTWGPGGNGFRWRKES